MVNLQVRPVSTGPTGLHVVDVVRLEGLSRRGVAAAAAGWAARRWRLWWWYVRSPCLMAPGQHTAPPRPSCTPVPTPSRSAPPAPGRVASRSSAAGSGVGRHRRVLARGLGVHRPPGPGPADTGRWARPTAADRTMQYSKELCDIKPGLRALRMPRVLYGEQERRMTECKSTVYNLVYCRKRTVL